MYGDIEKETAHARFNPKNRLFWDLKLIKISA